MSSSAPFYRSSPITTLVATLCLLLVSTVASARPACSKSDQLYETAKRAGVTINGTWITLPKAPEWERLVPLYDMLKDYDASVAYGNDCKAMVRRLREKVIERIRLHGTFLVIEVEDALNRLRGKAVVTVDGRSVPVQGESAAKGDDETLPGHVIFRGRHEVRVQRPVLHPGEKLILDKRFDGEPLGKGEALDFDLIIPAGSSSGPTVHKLTLGIGIQRSCRVRLRVSGELLGGAPRPGEPQFVAEVYNPSQFTNQRIQNGDYLFTAGDYTLSLKLAEGQLPVGKSPRVILDDAQVGLRKREEEGLATWQRRLPLACPADQAQGETTLELGFTGGRTARVALSETEPPESGASRSVPTLTWIGLTVAGVGATVAAVSYFGFQSPAVSDADALFRENGCGEPSAACTTEVITAIEDYWNQRDSAFAVTTTAAIVGGVGAAVAVGAWLLAEPAGDEASSRPGLQVLPMFQATSAAVHVSGTF